MAKRSIAKKDNNDLQEEFEDTKGVIRIRNSKKNREDNGQRTITIYKTYT
jgi:hypothetical protein